MTHNAERLRVELEHLSREDRAELAAILIRSLDDNAENESESAEEIEQAWREELDRRFEEIQSGADVMESGEQVMDELRKRFP